MPEGIIRPTALTHYPSWKGNLQFVNNGKKDNMKVGILLLKLRVAVIK